MSFGALSEEAKVALSRGAQLASTWICSGEGGMLAEEQAEIPAITMSLRQPGLAGGQNWSKMFRHSISRVVKGPRLARVAICPAIKCKAKLLRYAD